MAIAVELENLRRRALLFLLAGAVDRRNQGHIATKVYPGDHLVNRFAERSRVSWGMRPETKAKRKIEALERRRALIDALIEFIRTHPLAVDGASLHPLANRVGLRYDYAVIRPMWVKDGVVLRLEKYLEDWYDETDYTDYVWMGVSAKRIACEDVTNVPDEKLVAMVNRVHYELIPEDFEEEGESEG